MTTLRKGGEVEVVGGKNVEETKEEAREREEGRVAAENVAHECVICLEEFTMENPEMHTRKGLCLWERKEGRE